MSHVAMGPPEQWKDFEPYLSQYGTRAYSAAYFMTLQILCFWCQTATGS